MSFPFTNNRFLPVNIKGDDNIASDLNGNVSLLCNGKTSLYGDTTISEGKVLAIGKSPSSSTYPLDVSGNIQYSGNLYKAGEIQDRQNSTITYELPATASVVCNKDYVYQGLNNTTILTVQLPDESTIAIGYRFVVYPMKNWLDIRPTGSITINCESGSEISNFSLGTLSVSMTTNNTWYEFICVATTGTVRWVVIDNDPRTLLVRNNAWSAINSFQAPLYIKGYYPVEAFQTPITATGTLTAYTGAGNLLYSVYTVEAAADTTITLPTISGTSTGSYSVGNRITFIRSVANSTFNVSFIGSSSQFVYGTNNIGGITAQNLMPTGSLRCSFVSARDTATTFGWFQIDTDFATLRTNQTISGAKTYSGTSTYSGSIISNNGFVHKVWYPFDTWPGIITASIALTAIPGSAGGLRTVYIVDASAAPITITLPTINATGNYSTINQMTFIRPTSNATNPISFVGNGTQKIYNFNNIPSTTAQVLIPAGTGYKVTLVSSRETNAPTFAWYVVNENTLSITDISNNYVGVANTQTISGAKTFSALTEQAVDSTIRSNWATGGTLGKLYRNISEILTPLNYDLTTKTLGIYDEVNDKMFSFDLSGSQFVSAAALNNFWYEIVCGRSVTVDYDVKVGRDLQLSNQILGGVVRNVIIDPSANRILQITAGDEVSLGKNALSLSTGTENIAIGNNAGNTNTTGIRNIFISPIAPVGVVQTGTNCTYIGYGTGNSGVGNWNSSVAIGTGALITASNQISLGVSNTVTIARGTLQVINSLQMLGGSFTTPFQIPLEASPSLITASTNLSAVANYNQYTIEPTAPTTPMTITLANITLSGNHRVGIRITFTRGIGGSTNTISFIGGNTSQPVYDINGVNIGGGTVAQALMTADIKQITLQGVRPTATTFGWMVVSQNGIDFSSAQTITGAKTFTTGGLTISPSTNLNLNGTFVSNFLNISPTEIKLLEVGGQVIIKDNTTGNSLIRFNNSSGTNLSTAVGLNALAVETQSAGRNNCSFGANSMLLNTIGRYNCAFGVNSLRNQTGTTFSYNSGFGWSSLENLTVGTYTSSLGARTGTQVTTAEGCTFLGAVSDLSGTTQYNYSTAVGYGCLIENSNEVRLGRSSETVVCPNRIQVQNSYISTASPTIITTTTTLSGVLFRYYSVTSSAPYSITLPAAAVGYLGCSVTFRRVNGTITNAITSASANIFPVNSVTASTSLLDASVCQITIVCMLLTATPTYGWVVV